MLVSKTTNGAVAIVQNHYTDNGRILVKSKD